MLSQNIDFKLITETLKIFLLYEIKVFLIKMRGTSVAGKIQLVASAFGRPLPPHSDYGQSDKIQKADFGNNSRFLVSLPSTLDFYFG